MGKLLEIIRNLQSGIAEIEQFHGQAYISDDVLGQGVQKIKQQIKELVKIEIGGGVNE